MNNRKRNIRIGIGIIAAYAAVIVLLLEAESRAEGSSIHSIGDAIWYSIITLTTVGYGDISPVSPAGRVLGVILALCSLGLITALLGILLSVISNQTIPRMKLKHSRKFRWFVFKEYNEQSAALVSSIKSEEPDARIIFCDSDAKRKYDKGVIYLDCSPEELIDLKGSSERILYFCIGDDSWDNFGKAKEAAGLGIETYCLSDYGLKEIMGNLHIYSRKVIISRCYWKDYPVARNEKTIVLIGSGDIAAELLGRGLLTNVFEAGRYISYHVFGDSSYFRNAHPEIIKALCGGNPENDSLFLHEECWQHHAGIIRNADRIIICEDDDKSNLRIYKELIRYFPTSADVHLRLDAHAEQIACFGSIGSVFTLASFIRDDINRLAVIHNKIYSEDSETPIEWSELSDHQKGSNITAADHMIVKVRFILEDDSIKELTEDNCRRAYEAFRDADAELRDVCREMEHRRWMRFYQMFNWSYSPERDDRMRRHPLMVPYADLSENDKEKDAYAWEMLGRVADKTAGISEEARHE